LGGGSFLEIDPGGSRFLEIDPGWSRFLEIDPGGSGFFVVVTLFMVHYKIGIQTQSLKINTIKTFYIINF